MATNQFSTGKDCTLVIIHPLAIGGRLDLPLITDFHVTGKYHELKSSAIDGFTRTQHIPESMELTFTVDRADAAVEAFCSAVWLAYRTAGRVPDGTIYAYTNEIDGSQSTLQFDGVAFKPEDLGSFKKESSVSQKVSATAMDFRKI